MAAVPASSGTVTSEELEQQMVSVASMSSPAAIHSEISMLQAKLEFYSELAVLMAQNREDITQLNSNVVGPASSAISNREKSLNDLVEKAGNPIHEELARAVKTIQTERESIANRLTKLQTEEDTLNKRISKASSSITSHQKEQAIKIQVNAANQLAKIIQPHHERWLRFSSQVYPKWAHSVATLQQKIAAIEAADRLRSKPSESYCSIM
eukprot:TRINITY_DN4158_c0_g1_i1.p1 TRINITY_DN4158_c0_g1~~TRINITY_DN4158_c0_g1_i1.p1  ORF type:complete len:210 (+),score=48.20 TRINITY_DN4158_c0_g1_i1:55-684(+)